MKIGRILHQQVVQLRWHFLACLGLVMILPIEEAIINVKDGEGFYSAQISIFSLAISPFLAGLIACANVQADLDDKRYLFWRSKPVGIKRFLALKYVAGLLLAALMFLCPYLFTVISCMICHPDFHALVWPFVINCGLILIMVYSLCFFCNVLIRKTARAWLIGMAMTVFILLTPFILPLNFKDTRDFVITASVVYLSFTLVPSLIAFIVSLVAVSHNWHLQTNLKGLLWTGAALIFLVLLLFTRQVANIKVLDTKTKNDYACLIKIGEKYVFGERYEYYSNGNVAEIRGNNITLDRIDSMYPGPYGQLRADKIERFKDDNALKLVTYPEDAFVYYKVQGELYALALFQYYKSEKEEYKEGRFRNIHIDKECYLKCFKVVDGQHVLVDSLDLSDCLQGENNRYLTMRLVGDKIIAFVSDQCISIIISNSGKMEIAQKGRVKRYSHRHMLNKEQDFKIPLIPSETIDIQERIRASIDFNFWGYYGRGEIFARRSLVDVYEGRISFYHIDENEILRFDVIEWDNEYVYCRFRDARPFTFLEQRVSPIHHGWRFVQDGKLYAYHDAKLMILDIRSERMRKLGHWERWADDYWIGELEVLENGNLLLSARERKRVNEGKLSKWRSYLHLLKNPE
jgi:hypothetical protein